MKRVKAKWTACFLAAVMVITMMPLSVFAADDPADLIKRRRAAHKPLS